MQLVYQECIEKRLNVFLRHSTTGPNSVPAGKGFQIFLSSLQCSRSPTSTFEWADLWSKKELLKQWELRMIKVRLWGYFMKHNAKKTLFWNRCACTQCSMICWSVWTYKHACIYRYAIIPHFCHHKRNVHTDNTNRSHILWLSNLFLCFRGLYEMNPFTVSDLSNSFCFSANR